MPRTYEYIHYSVREKADEIVCSNFPLSTRDISKGFLFYANAISRASKLTEVLPIVMIAKSQTRHLQERWRVLSTPL